MAWKLEAQRNEIIFLEQNIGFSSKITFFQCRQLENEACVLGLGLPEAFASTHSYEFIVSNICHCVHVHAFEMQLIQRANENAGIYTGLIFSIQII